MLEHLTIESFEPYIGTSFWAEFPNGHKVELRLVRAAKVMANDAARLQRHPFSLFFLGPKSFRLQQRIYLLSHAQLERISIFIVPIGEEADGFVYEAVFA